MGSVYETTVLRHRRQAVQDCEPRRGDTGELCPMIARAPGLVKISYCVTENWNPKEHGNPTKRRSQSSESVEADAPGVSRVGTREEGQCRGEPGSPCVRSP